MGGARERAVTDFFATRQDCQAARNFIFIVLGTGLWPLMTVQVVVKAPENRTIAGKSRD
jgi:hypothetical protein